MSRTSLAAPLVAPHSAALAVLGICFVQLLVARGILEAYAVFLLPLVQDFGWQRTAVSGVYAVSFLVMGWSGPLIGILFDRWGPLRLYALGIGSLAIGLVVTANADALWHFYLGFGILVGLGAACVGAVPTAALLSRWFRARLNSAMAVAYSAGGIGILLLAPLAQALLDRFGWRTALLLLAALVAALVPLLWLVMHLRAGEGHPRYREPAAARSADEPRAQGPTLRMALRSSSFWALCWVFCFTGIGMYSVMLQIPAFLIEQGYTPAAAAQLFGFCGLLAPAGMVGFGWLGDRIGRRRAILLSYALTLCGIASLWLLAYQRHPLLLLLFIVTFGGTFGARGPAISTVAATLFRGPQLGRIYGFVTIGMGLGGALGAYFGGFWHDLTGGYDAGFAFSLAMAGLGGLPWLILPALARPVRVC